MQILTPEDHQRLHAELIPGEQILWSGKPNPKVIFHEDDWFMIPVSLLWAGGTLYPHLGILRSLTIHDTNPLEILLASIFLIAGQYFVWGRFVFAAWKKPRILYAVTQIRVFVLTRTPHRTIQAYIGDIPIIHQKIRKDRIGTLEFGESGIFNTNRGSMSGLHTNSPIPTFVDIDDAPAVCSLVSNLPLTIPRNP